MSRATLAATKTRLLNRRVRFLASLALVLTLAACGPAVPRMLAAPSSSLAVSGIRADSDRRFAVLLEGNTGGEIFSSYAADRPSSWARNFTQRFDFTGVAWDDPHTATLVSPLHVVMAAHYQRPVGSALVFHDRRGRPQRRTLVEVISLAGTADVAVGKLDAPLPPGVRPYRLLPPSPDYGVLAGCLAVVTDQHRKVFLHEIDAIQANTLAFRHAARVSPPLRKHLAKGDSGNPSFLVVGGELALIETHTHGGPGTGPFYSSPAVFQAVNGAMAKLGGGHQLSVVPLAR